jgi:phosphoserine phosphatase
VCAVVTATERLVAEPFARAFGIEHLVATEGVMVDGRPTGEIDGLPCFREHKLTRVQQWLAGLSDAHDTIAAFDESFFYSDSINDLPLLQAVTRPVAVRPDERLRAHALVAGWRVIDDQFD